MMLLKKQLIAALAAVTLICVPSLNASAATPLTMTQAQTKLTQVANTMMPGIYRNGSLTSSVKMSISGRRVSARGVATRNGVNTLFTKTGSVKVGSLRSVSFNVPKGTFCIDIAYRGANGRVAYLRFDSVGGTPLSGTCS